MFYHRFAFLLVTGLSRQSSVVGDTAETLPITIQDGWYKEKLAGDMLGFFFSSGKYLVCDTTEKQEPKSWLRTDFIEFNGAKRVFIYISYTIRKCKSISRYCKEHFKLYAAQTSKSALSPKPPNGFEEIAIAQPQNLKDGVPYERDVIVLNATIKAKMGGFYLAFLDQGVCLTLYSIKVMFYFCPEYYPDLVKFPRTISPAEDIVGSQGQVHGSCSDSNAKSTSKLLGVCTTKGVWKTNASCLCKPGYEYLTHPRRRCKVCGFDQYKSSLDNSRCKTCPVGSYPFAQKTECRCNSGFFRINEKDNEPCYAPSGPVTLDEKKGSYSKTTIVPASGIGGTLAPSGPVTLDEKKGSYSKTTIVASGIGGTLGLLFVIALLVCYLVNRRQKKLLKMQYKAMKYLRGDEDSKFDPNRSILEQCEELPYDADWEFPVKRLILQGVIGSGAFGQVMKAEAVGILSFSAGDKKSIALKRRLKLRRRLMFNHIFQDSAGNDCTRTTVAVKMLKAEANESDYKDLAIELKIMIHLGEHSNIINLLGACTRSEQLMVIMEFAPHGNLLNFLRSRREIYEATWRKTANNPDAEFTLADLVMFSYQIARGMDFLSSKKCVHRDLAARNVLVGEDYVMKIADFGLARDIYKSDLYVKETTGLLPLKWMAPESLFDRVYTLKTDIWSFGIVLWETQTLGGTPYPDIPVKELMDYLSGGQRMRQPKDCPPEIYAIMRDCWLQEPSERPTFSELVRRIERIIEKKISGQEAGDAYISVFMDEGDMYLEPKEAFEHSSSNSARNVVPQTITEEEIQHSPLPPVPCISLENIHESAGTDNDDQPIQSPLSPEGSSKSTDRVDRKSLVRSLSLGTDCDEKRVKGELYTTVDINVIDIDYQTERETVL